jgi:hypothetical protein
MCDLSQRLHEIDGSVNKVTRWWLDEEDDGRPSVGAGARAFRAGIGVTVELDVAAGTTCVWARTSEGELLLFGLI